MRIRVFSCACLCLLLLTSACGCQSADPMIGENEDYVKVEGSGAVFEELSPADLPAGSAESAWLLGCSGDDRNDYFDAYVLYHESTVGENTTHTYLIYYPHEDMTLGAEAALLQDGDGHVIRILYTDGDMNGASLSYLSVTLPAGSEPELSLIHEGDELGILTTRTQTPIARP